VIGEQVPLTHHYAFGRRGCPGGNTAATLCLPRESSRSVARDALSGRDRRGSGSQTEISEVRTRLLVISTHPAAQLYESTSHVERIVFLTR
jgi:hypothetical protein